MIGSLVVPLVFLAMVFTLLEGTRRHAWWRRDGGLDLLYWVVTPLIHKGSQVAMFLGVAATMLVWPWREQMAAHWQGVPRPLQILVLLFVSDFFGYWVHRLFHRGPWWKFHAVHHSSTELDWLSAVRLHPLNELVDRGLQVIPLYCLGFDGHLLAGYVPFLTFYAIMVHADLPWDFGPLRTVIATPRFHRWHHSSDLAAIDKNFAGLFPVWDILFGTFYMPVGLEPSQFGTTANDVPRTLPAQLAYPFK